MPADRQTSDASSVAMPAVGGTTLRQEIDAQARTDPDRVFCTFGDQVLRFGALDEAVNRVANGLLAQGLRPGDRVALMLPSHPDHIICIFALAKIGLVRVPVNISLKGPSLDYPFEAFAVEALIADRAFADALAPVLARRRLRALFWRGGADGQFGFEDLLRHHDSAAPPVEPGPDDIIAITPSSGTTGAPKGVLKSDRTLRAGPLAILRLTEAKAGDTFLFWEAMHHGAGVAVLIAAVLGRLHLGMVERFSASRFWQQARAHGATHVHYLGSVLPMVLRQPERAEDRGHGVRMAWGGGCPAEIWQPFQRRFGVALREGYGLSELITFCTLNLTGKAGSVGRPLSWFEAMIADESGQALPPGAVGELCFRACEPGLRFPGYFRNEAASAETMRDGWFRTGDLARQDEEGDLFFAGRAKDSVRRRGINISAWEVERVLLEHPEIEEVGLIGVRMLHVPYRGGAPALTDVVAGQVDLMFATLPNVMQNGGGVKVLAIATEARSAVVPQVPTAAEAGFPGFAVSSIYSVLAPAGTPPAVVAQLSQELQAAVAQQGIRERLLQQGVMPEPAGAEATGQQVRSELVRWADVIRAARLQLQ